MKPNAQRGWQKFKTTVTGYFTDPNCYCFAGGIGLIVVIEHFHIIA